MMNGSKTNGVYIDDRNNQLHYLNFFFSFKGDDGTNTGY